MAQTWSAFRSNIGAAQRQTRVKVAMRVTALSLLLLTSVFASAQTKPAATTSTDILDGFATLVVDAIAGRQSIARGDQISGQDSHLQGFDLFADVNGPDGEGMRCVFRFATRSGESPQAAVAYYQQVIHATAPRPLGTPLPTLSYTSAEETHDPLILQRTEDWRHAGGGGYAISRTTTAVALRGHQIILFSKRCEGDTVYRLDAPLEQTIAHFNRRWDRAVLNVNRSNLTPLR